MKKILHITFHHSCELEIDSIIQRLAKEEESQIKIVTRHPSSFGIGYSADGEAFRQAWHEHSDYLLSFDYYFVSDTINVLRLLLPAVLGSRNKHLFVWGTNNADIFVKDHKHFFNCLEIAYNCERVHEGFNHWYFYWSCMSKGIPFQRNILENLSLYQDIIWRPSRCPEYGWPSSPVIQIGEDPVVQPEVEPHQWISFNRTNGTRIGGFIQSNYSELAKNMQVHGSYNYKSLSELRRWYKAAFEVPYVPHTMSHSEMINIGIPVIMPTTKLFQELLYHKLIISRLRFIMEETYLSRQKGVITVDSWDDLKRVLESDLSHYSKTLLAEAETRRREGLIQWRSFLSPVFK